jgi:hypothetical protein
MRCRIASERSFFEPAAMAGADVGRAERMLAAAQGPCDDPGPSR